MTTPAAGTEYRCFICCSWFRPGTKNLILKTEKADIERDNATETLQTLTQFSEYISLCIFDESGKECSDDADVSPQKRRPGRRKAKKKFQMTVEQHVDKLEKETLDKAENRTAASQSMISKILESCTKDNLNLSICPDCEAVMKETTEARLETVEVERRVQKLQCLLLQELRQLQNILGPYYEGVERMEKILINGDVASLSGYLSYSDTKNRKKLQGIFGKVPVNRYTIRKEQVLRLRRRMTEAARNVSLFRLDIESKVGGRKTGQRHFHVPPRVDSPSSPEHTAIKIEVHEDFNENNSDVGWDFGGHRSDSDSDGEEYDNAISNDIYPHKEPCRLKESISKNSKKLKDIASKNDVKVTSGSKFLPDEDQLKEDIPRNVKVVKTKAKKSPSKNISLMNLDFGKMTDFKRKILESIIKKQQQVKKQRRRKTPFQQYITNMKYNEEQQCLILDDLAIQILDKQENPDFTQNSLRCSECSFTTPGGLSSMEQTMYDHVIGKHLNGYTCPTCKLQLETDVKYRKHVIGCGGRFSCDICGRPMSSPGAVERHKYLHMNEEEKEAALAKGFLPQSHFNAKRQVVTAANHKVFCRICSRGFPNNVTLRAHEQIHKSVEEREHFDCPKCGKQFFKSGWTYHMKYTECAVASDAAPPPNPKKCELCGKMLKNKVMWKVHMRRAHSKSSHDKPFSCQKCGKAFRYNQSLKNHEGLHTGLKPYKCRKCGMGFFSPIGQFLHEKHCSYEEGEKSKEQSGYKCDRCKISFKIYMDYRIHSRRCRDPAELKLECDVCGKPVYCRSTLRVHKWRHFNEEEKRQAIARGLKPPTTMVPHEKRVLKYICEICSKAFYYKQNLTAHRERHKRREDRKLIVCTQCGKQFYDKSWASHCKYSDCALALEGVAATPGKCKHCGKVFKNKPRLKYHILMHHTEKGPQETFICLQCGKTLMSRRALRAHENTHAGLKPHQCSSCGKAFADKANMRRHEAICLVGGFKRIRRPPGVTKVKGTTPKKRGRKKKNKSAEDAKLFSL